MDIPSQSDDDGIQPENFQATLSTSQRQGRGFCELWFQMKHFEKLHESKTFISIYSRKLYNRIEDTLIEVDPREKIFQEKYSMKG